MKNKIIFTLLCVFSVNIYAQNTQNIDIPLKRIVILTSGLAFYEHSGLVSGQVMIRLPFKIDAVNDALKTLVINDIATANPSVTYQSEQTLLQTLRSLHIDLSDEPGIAVILSRLRGAEIEITAPTPYTGKITGIEYRETENSIQPWLLLNTNRGVRLFALSEVSSIRFTDPLIESDLNRALDLIGASRNSFSKELLVNLPGSGSRNISLSYIIPSPVWKVSYRLDLSQGRPLFQGWAIVDNDSDTDWKDVELSLIAGRPSSFIQALYPPYYVTRPIVPLSIAGTAPPTVYDQGWVGSGYLSKAEDSLVYESRPQSDSMLMARAAPSVEGGTVQTAAGSEAGGQFEFTIKNPVSLDRHMSVMLPLVEAQIDAKGLLIYSGSAKHPKLGAEITNNTKMKLPAGPITVYDGGVYAGDALIEFWNENEKRLISFGEDLTVTAAASSINTRTVTSVNVSSGVMTINRSLAYIKTYTFLNSRSVSRQLVAEHTKTSLAELASPAASEQTENVYRFNITLPANRETVLTVNEIRPIAESITLLSLRPDAFLSYTSNQEIPAAVRQALQKAVELKQEADSAALVVRNIETQRNQLIADQDRIRRNLEAAGSQTQQGQEYLRRLVALDEEIDALISNLAKANASSQEAQKAYENYLTSLNL
jgi:hypothetical protein